MLNHTNRFSVPVAALAERPGAIFLLALRLSLSEALIRSGIGPDHEEGGWFFLVAILGFGGRHLDVAHPNLRYAGEAVLPFYMLHQPIIVILGYVVRSWDMSIGVKYLVHDPGEGRVIRHRRAIDRRDKEPSSGWFCSFSEGDLLLHLW